MTINVPRATPGKAARQAAAGVLTGISDLANGLNGWNLPWADWKAGSAP
ncbi:hypothetical protein [Streptomyces sp. B21-083]